ATAVGAEAAAGRAARRTARRATRGATGRPTRGAVTAIAMMPSGLHVTRRRSDRDERDHSRNSHPATLRQHLVRSP
ncbi:MAG: hypothetical protein ACK55I_43525, partial [bacterium]